jgi:uncharacterized protein (TIGR02246 family)
MKIPSTRIATIAILAAIAGGLLIGRPWLATRADEPVRAEDEADVRKVSEAFARAFETGDAKAVGAFFTDSGEYVDDESEPIRGRAALEKAYAGFFAKRGEIKVQSKTDKIRFLGKDAAVEEGTFAVLSKNRPTNESRFSALYLREEGKWRIAMLKEWADENSTRPDLQDLAWLIGSWESDGPEMLARTTYSWGDNKKFIQSRFEIKKKNDNAVLNSGTQTIGVDPALGLIRAWTFGSDGSVGEAVWSHDGDRWSIDSRATLPDGSATSALNHLTREGDDEFRWRSVQRSVEGESQPDIATVKVRRVK